PSAAAILRAETLEGLGDKLLKAARASRATAAQPRDRTWEGALKLAIACYSAGGQLRWRAAAPAPISTAQRSAPGRFEDLLRAREGGAQRHGPADSSAPTPRASAPRQRRSRTPTPTLAAVAAAAARATSRTAASDRSAADGSPT